MKAYSIDNRVIRPYIEIELYPYPHVALGRGGSNRATWVALCEETPPAILSADQEAHLPHRITEAEIVRSASGQCLLVAPRNNPDDRVLVLWGVSSGNHGKAEIIPDEGVVVIAADKAWHPLRGPSGEKAEVLAILSPGQGLWAQMTGKDTEEIRCDRARLTWDGQNIAVAFFRSDALPWCEGRAGYL